MADDTLTLRLDGEVSLAAFRKAIESFADLVDALAEDITPSAAIACLVTHLEAGSAVATIRGQQQMVRSTTLRVSCTRMRLSARC